MKQQEKADNSRASSENCLIIHGGLVFGGTAIRLSNKIERGGLRGHGVEKYNRREGNCLIPGHCY